MAVNSAIAVGRCCAANINELEPIAKRSSLGIAENIDAIVVG
jgi:hypothetical protein